jgi:hypothetical protein
MQGEKPTTAGEQQSNSPPTDAEPVSLAQVLDELLDDIASDPEAGERREWARLLQADDGADQAGRGGNLQDDSEADWPRPRKPR